MARRSGRGSGHVYQRRDGRWEGVLQADFPDGSKRKSFYGTRQADVIAKLDKAKADLRSGIMPTPERFTTAAFLRAWIEGRRGKVRDNTWRRYEGIITKNIVPLVGNVPLVRLGSADVNRMTARLQESGLSAQTAAHARSVLRLALNAAVEDGILPRNVAALRSCAVPVDRPTLVATTPEHARRITAAFTDHRLDALVSIALSTGARQGELLALRWSDVDFDARQLRIERTLQRGVFTAPKTKRSRRSIDLSDGDVATLRSHRESQKVASIGDLVFCRADGQPHRSSDVTHAFQRVLKAAGVASMRFHDLRHANATLLLVAGVPVHVVSERLGHADVKTTLGVYAHVIPAQRRDAADRMAHLLAGVGSF